MSTEQNKSIVRRYLDEVWGRGDISLLSQFVTRDICDHSPAPGQPRGLEGQRWVVEAFRRSIPDLRLTVEQLVAEGDYVADHWTCSGTQTGELFGMPATGKRFTITGTDMARLSDGKIDEIWHVEDTLSLVQQLGLAPAFPQQGSSSGQPTTAGSAGGSGQRRTLSDDEKRATIRRGYEEFIDRGNLAAVDTLLTPDFVGHFAGFPPVHGREEFKRFLRMYTSAISGNHAAVEQIVVEGDRAACRVRYSGRQTGTLLGIRPTGNQVNVDSLSLFRFSGDQVAEQWANNDDMGLMVQIGAIEAPAGVEMATPC